MCLYVCGHLYTHGCMHTHRETYLNTDSFGGKILIQEAHLPTAVFEKGKEGNWLEGLLYQGS